MFITTRCWRVKQSPDVFFVLCLKSLSRFHDLSTSLKEVQSLEGIEQLIEELGENISKLSVSFHQKKVLNYVFFFIINIPLDSFSLLNSFAFDTNADADVTYISRKMQGSDCVVLSYSLGRRKIQNQTLRRHPS